MEKKLTYQDAINENASPAVEYNRILAKIDVKNLKKALKILETMPQTKTKVKLITKELKIREKGEPLSHGGIPISLLEEWDKVTAQILKRKEKNGV